MAQARFCKIVDADISDETGAGDGAYDLLDVSGTPDEVAKEIAGSLKECDILRGGKVALLADEGQALTLTICIRITAEKPEEENDCPECQRSFGPNYSGPCEHE